MVDITNTGGFDWDYGNANKIIGKHNVIPSETEQVFFNEPLLSMDDSKHNQEEARYHALGITDDRRLLHVTFTLRAQDTLIRIISARNMRRKEKKVYEQTQRDS